MLWFVLIIFIAAIVATISIGYDMKGDPPIYPRRHSSAAETNPCGEIPDALPLRHSLANTALTMFDHKLNIVASSIAAQMGVEPTLTPQTDVSPKLLLHRASKQIHKIMTHYNNLYDSIHYLKYVCIQDIGKNIPKDENTIFMSEIVDYTVSMQEDFIHSTEDILTVGELFTIYVDKLVNKGIIELRDYDPALHEVNDSLEYYLHYINVSAKKIREFRKKDKNVS